MREHAEYYAEAFNLILSAEGTINEALDELFRFARIIEGNDELRNTLTDAHLPAARRQQIVEDLLGGRAFPSTIGIVSLVVATGRARDLPTIVDLLLKRTAALNEAVLAEVRSAVELTDDQKARLTESLRQATGHQKIKLQIMVDPTVLGGIVTQIGDTVIDGSIRHRLAQLKESF